MTVQVKAFQLAQPADFKHNSIGRSSFRFIDLGKLWNVSQDDPGVHIIALVKWKHNAALKLGLRLQGKRLFFKASHIQIYPRIQSCQLGVKQLFLAVQLALNNGVLQVE